MSYKGREGNGGGGDITVVAAGLVDLGHLSCHRRRRHHHHHHLGTLVARDELCGSNIESAFRGFIEAQLLRTRTWSNSESSMIVIF